MVGRTPEYLGKKIEAFEMKMASIVILIPPLLVLVRHGDRRDDATPARAGVANPGAHGFSRNPLRVLVGGQQQRQRLRAGSRANTPFYNTALGIAMLFARYWLAIPMLAIAGALAAAKKRAARRPARCRRTRRCSSSCWSAPCIIVGALTFVPALALGPIVEHSAPDTPATDREATHEMRNDSEPLQATRTLSWFVEPAT